jgi:hypothetical protein
MKLFSCQSCGQVLYFGNTICERCGHRLGFLPDDLTLAALDADGDHWIAMERPGSRYKFCANAAHDVCNWLVPAGNSDAFCVACRHNRTIPDMANAEHMLAWKKLEEAKHRLFYTLERLHLPLDVGMAGPGERLVFDFLADPQSGPKILTGHDDGVIVISLAEADDAEREARRKAMGEVYRTLLGHFRHEVGHYFWDLLVAGEGRLDAFRALFGDERVDYAASLQKHYTDGPPASWQDAFVSAYATTHPWEDFAETWAHYLHIVDTLETAYAFGLDVTPRLDKRGDLHARANFDAYTENSLQRIVDTWLPVSFAVNSINEAMGQRDLYPFILSTKTVEKLSFIHDLVRAPRRIEGSQNVAA